MLDTIFSKTESLECAKCTDNIDTKLEDKKIKKGERKVSLLHKRAFREKNSKTIKHHVSKNGVVKKYQEQAKGISKAYLKKFDADEIEVLRKVYEELESRNPEMGIDKATFLQYFSLPGLWGERLFQQFDYKRLGVVDYEEFLIGIAICCRGTRSEKIQVLFQIFDLNGDGVIQKGELIAMLSNLPSLERYVFHTYHSNDCVSDHTCKSINKQWGSFTKLVHEVSYKPHDVCSQASYHVESDDNVVTDAMRSELIDKICHTSSTTGNNSFFNYSVDYDFDMNLEGDCGIEDQALINQFYEDESNRICSNLPQLNKKVEESNHGVDVHSKSDTEADHRESIVDFTPPSENQNQLPYDVFDNKEKIYIEKDWINNIKVFPNYHSMKTKSDEEKVHETKVVSLETLSSHSKKSIHFQDEQPEHHIFSGQDSPIKIVETQHHNGGSINILPNTNTNNNNLEKKLQDVSKANSTCIKTVNAGYDKNNDMHNDHNNANFASSTLIEDLTFSVPEQIVYDQHQQIMYDQHQQIDIEAFVDKIIEECEFSDSNSLTFMDFKTWLENNNSILTMFNECLHEEAWGLQGNAFYRTSLQNRRFCHSLMTYSCDNHQFGGVKTALNEQLQSSNIPFAYDSNHNLALFRFCRHLKCLFQHPFKKSKTSTYTNFGQNTENHLDSHGPLQNDEQGKDHYYDINGNNHVRSNTIVGSGTDENGAKVVSDNFSYYFQQSKQIEENLQQHRLSDAMKADILLKLRQLFTIPSEIISKEPTDVHHHHHHHHHHHSATKLLSKNTNDSSSPRTVTTETTASLGKPRKIRGTVATSSECSVYSDFVHQNNLNSTAPSQNNLSKYKTYKDYENYHHIVESSSPLSEYFFLEKWALMKKKLSGKKVNGMNMKPESDKERRKYLNLPTIEIKKCCSNNELSYESSFYRTPCFVDSDVELTFSSQLNKCLYLKQHHTFPESGIVSSDLFNAPFYQLNCPEQQQSKLDIKRLDLNKIERDKLEQQQKSFKLSRSCINLGQINNLGEHNSIRMLNSSCNIYDLSVSMKPVESVLLHGTGSTEKQQEKFDQDRSSVALQQTDDNKPTKLSTSLATEGYLSNSCNQQVSSQNENAAHDRIPKLSDSCKKDIFLKPKASDSLKTNNTQPDLENNNDGHMRRPIRNLKRRSLNLLTRCGFYTDSTRRLISNTDSVHCKAKDRKSSSSKNESLHVTLPDIDRVPFKTCDDVLVSTSIETSKTLQTTQTLQSYKSSFTTIEAPSVEQHQLGCPYCKCVLDVCPKCSKTVHFQLRLTEQSFSLECTHCVNNQPTQFYACWHCAWMFSKAFNYISMNEILQEGYLYVKGRHLNQFKKLYYVLIGNLLYCYNNKDDIKPQGFLFLKECFVEPLIVLSPSMSSCSSTSKLPLPNKAELQIDPNGALANPVLKNDSCFISSNRQSNSTSRSQVFYEVSSNMKLKPKLFRLNISRRFYTYMKKMKCHAVNKLSQRKKLSSPLLATSTSSSFISITPANGHAKSNNRAKGSSKFFGFTLIHGSGKIPRREFYVKTEQELNQWIKALKQAAQQRKIEDVYRVEELIGQGKFSFVHKAEVLHNVPSTKVNTLSSGPTGGNSSQPSSVVATQSNGEPTVVIDQYNSHLTGQHYQPNRNLSENHFVAIKYIEKNKITQHERELLRSEMAILRLLHHPHVIQFKEILDTQHTIHIVMEYVEGGELYHLLQDRQRLPEVQVNRIIFQLLSTVAYLHSCGIIHRDLKPENILLTNKKLDADIKITDFGLSCMCGPNEYVYHPCGTLAYVAPEVLTLQGYNHKVDVWSVGIIMYLLLRGRLPFPILNRRVIMQQGNNNNNNAEVTNENQAPQSCLVNNTKIPDLFQKLLNFDGPIWDNISSSAKDLLRMLLEPVPEKRISAHDALQHIWLKNPTAVITTDTDNHVPLVDDHRPSKELDIKKSDNVQKKTSMKGLKVSTISRHDSLSSPLRYVKNNMHLSQNKETEPVDDYRNYFCSESVLSKNLDIKNLQHYSTEYDMMELCLEQSTSDLVFRSSPSQSCGPRIFDISASTFTIPFIHKK